MKRGRSQRAKREEIIDGSGEDSSKSIEEGEKRVDSFTI